MRQLSGFLIPTGRIVLIVDLCGVALILLLAGVPVSARQQPLATAVVDSSTATLATKEELEATVVEPSERLICRA